MAGLAAPGHRNAETPSAWRATLSGLCASLVGIGLARFAYTPLLPAIIAAHWFPAQSAAYLGAANLTGYLAGALLAAPAAARMPVVGLLRGMMALATVAFFACAWPVDFAWFFAWRFASGVAGGALMVLAAPTILPHIAASRRGLASGAIFTGVGLGIAMSGTLVPLLLAHGLTRTWLGLGICALLLTAIAWGGWPRGPAAPVAGHAPPHDAGHEPPHDAGHAPPHDAGHPSRRTQWQLRALVAGYALNAAGLVPHMLFLVDYVARGLGEGVQTGAGYWVLFGLGAVVGPVLTGHLADRIGFAAALRAGYVVQAVAVAAAILGGPFLLVSSVVVGAFTPGIVPLVLGRIHELLARHPADQKAAWGRATTGFATLQALAAYGMSFVLSASGSYAALFGIGAGALLLALVVDVGVASKKDVLS